MKEQFVLLAGEHFITENNKITEDINYAKTFTNLKDAEAAAKEILTKYAVYNIDIISIEFKTIKQYSKRMEIVCLDKQK